MPVPFDLTDEALADFKEIVGSLAEGNPPAAHKLADEFEEAFRFLADWPAAGHMRQDLSPSDEARFWMVTRYMVVYVQSGDRILVIAVFHGSRDIKSLLPRRLELL